jgi:hypothetical protein
VLWNWSDSCAFFEKICFNFNDIFKKLIPTEVVIKKKEEVICLSHSGGAFPMKVLGVKKLIDNNNIIITKYIYQFDHCILKCNAESFFEGLTKDELVDFEELKRCFKKFENKDKNIHCWCNLFNNLQGLIIENSELHQRTFIDDKYNIIIVEDIVRAVNLFRKICLFNYDIQNNLKYFKIYKGHEHSSENFCEFLYFENNICFLSSRKYFMESKIDGEKNNEIKFYPPLNDNEYIFIILSKIKETLKEKKLGNFFFHNIHEETISKLKNTKKIIYPLKKKDYNKIHFYNLFYIRFLFVIFILCFILVLLFYNININNLLLLMN